MPAPDDPDLSTAEPGAKFLAEAVGETPRSAAADEEFDLDAALSIDPGETNRMQALTAELENVAADPRAEEPGKVPSAPDGDFGPSPADVLTLSASHDEPSAESAEHALVAEVATESPAVSPEPEPEPELDMVEELPPPAATKPEPFSTEDTATSQTNIDLLEAALEAAKRPHTDPSPDGGLQATGPSVADVPEITLDETLADRQPTNRKLEKFAQEIGKASSLEDISDTMAETLFGEEFSQIAAAVVANPPPDVAAPGEAADNSSPVMLDDAELLDAVKSAPEPAPRAKSGSGPGPKPLAPPTKTNITEQGLRESMAMRIEMLNAMKNKSAGVSHEQVELGEDPSATDVPGPNGPPPEPIENQINTSITQTLQALNVSKLAESGKSTGKKDKKSGLFGRFKKSS
jgi:hypothetical protein